MRRMQIILSLMGGLLALLVLAAMLQPQSARASIPRTQMPGRLGVESGSFSTSGNPQSSPPLSVMSAATGVSCTLSTSQTVGVGTNQTFTSAILLSNAFGRSLVPKTDVPLGATVRVPSYEEFFKINAIVGNSVYVSVVPNNAQAGNYDLGLTVYDGRTDPPTPFFIDENPSDFSAEANFKAPFTGLIYFKVYQLNTANECTGGTYNILNFANSTPTPTPSRTATPVTPTPTTGPSPTPYAGAPNHDAFEPNNNFDTATTIGLGVKYPNLNFVNWDINSDEWDNDFFRVRVKPGMLVTCRTLELKPGTDTNLILYDNNLNGITGNDDNNRAAGDLSSSVTYYVTYEGWLYGLVGEGFSRSPSEQAATGYSYECIIGTQSTPTIAPTPTFAPGVPTFTPIPPTPTETLTPSPTLTPTPPFVHVKPLPTATPAGLPTTQIPVSLLAYYDANGNNKYDPGEGIVGVSARVIDLTTGKLLAQGLTDETGRASFTVNAPGAVQLAVPYLNYSTIILPSGGAATVRVSARDLPRAIP